ncbi:MAG: Ger(x)C family spore germination protein [Tissierellales bacterium]
MKYIRVFLKLIIIINLLMILIGCWNYSEADDEFIVTAVAIDKAEEGYIVTVEVTYPKKGSGSGLDNEYFSEQGRTIFEAIRKTILQTGRKMYWGHAKVVIISRDIAEEGILSVIEFLIRDTDVRNKMWLIISTDETASVLFKVEDEVHNSIGFHFDDILRNQEKVGMGYGGDLLDTLACLSSEGVTPKVATASNIKTIGGVVPRVEGMAIFNRDKMIGRIDGLDVKTFLLIINKFKGGEYKVLNLGNTDFSLEILESKTKLKPIIEDGNIIMEIDIKMDMWIVEGEGNFMSSESLVEIRKKMEKNITSDIERVVKKVQSEYNSDIFGFGRAIYKHKPNVWKDVSSDWDREFSKVKVQANVEITIKGTGLLEKPIRTKN